MKYATLPALPAGIDPAIFWPATLEGLEAQKGRVEKMITGIKQLAGKKPVKKQAEAPADTAPARNNHRKPRRKRNLSPEARKRIAEAQKKRWAAVRKVDAA